MSFALAGATALAGFLGAADSTGASAAVTSRSASALPAAPVPVPYVNEATRRCLDDSAAGLRTVGCNGTSFQRWNSRLNSGNASFDMKNVATGLCLDDSRAYHLRAIGCNGLLYQRWIVSRRWRDHSFQLSNNATGLCLDDSNAHGLRTFTCGTSQTPWQSWFYTVTIGR